MSLIFSVLIPHFCILSISLCRWDLTSQASDLINKGLIWGKGGVRGGCVCLCVCVCMTLMGPLA